MQLQRVTALALCGPYSCRGDRRAVHVGRVPVQGAEEEGVVQERMRDETAESPSPPNRYSRYAVAALWVVEYTLLWQYAESAAGRAHLL
jgi:hypothetical protein